MGAFTILYNAITNVYNANYFTIFALSETVSLSLNVYISANITQKDF